MRINSLRAHSPYTHSRIIIAARALIDAFPDCLIPAKSRSNVNFQQLRSLQFTVIACAALLWIIDLHKSLEQLSFFSHSKSSSCSTYINCADVSITRKFYTLWNRATSIPRLGEKGIVVSCVYGGLAHARTHTHVYATMHVSIKSMPGASSSVSGIYSFFPDQETRPRIAGKDVC